MFLNICFIPASLWGLVKPIGGGERGARGEGRGDSAAAEFPQAGERRNHLNEYTLSMVMWDDKAHQLSVFELPLFNSQTQLPGQVCE